MEKRKRIDADCQGRFQFIISLVSYIDELQIFLIFGEAVSHSSHLITMFRLHRNDEHGWVWEYKPPDRLSKEP